MLLGREERRELSLFTQTVTGKLVQAWWTEGVIVREGLKRRPLLETWNERLPGPLRHIALVLSPMTLVLTPTYYDRYFMVEGYENMTCLFHFAR